MTTVRDARIRDAAACAAIYAAYVDTPITFETEAPDTDAMAGRLATALATHAWLVLEDAGRVAGYAYARRFHERAAYRWACESTILVEPGRRRTGAGRRLYTALFDRLAGRGFRTVIAGVTLPNEGSVGLHQAMGFRPVGTYREVGYKLGAWHDVMWLQRPLADTGDPPPEPR